MALITFGDVKIELAEAAENGVTADDARIIARVNSAQRALARAVPRGVFVGGTMSAVVAVNAANKTFALPPEMDVAFSIETTTGVALPNGWYNIASTNTLVDSDDLMDTAFVDQGVNAATGIRSYAVPELPAGITQLLVNGLKAFAPVVNDATVLYVQNIEAIKFWLKSLFLGQKADNVEKAKNYRAFAVEELTNELARHLDDPTRYAARLAQWRVDANTYADRTLGNIAARLALDFGNGQKLGRIKLYRLVNEASRQAVQIFNALGAEQRYDLNPGPNQLTFVQAVLPSDVLTYGDYEVINYLVKSQGPTLKPEEIITGKQAATQVIQRNLASVVDATRNTARNVRLTGSNVNTLGYITAKMGLELPNVSVALTFSDFQFSRWVNEAAREAVAHQNFLGRSERYSNADGPNVLDFIPAATFSDVVSYTDYEVLSLLVRAQIAETGGTDAAASREEARALIQRNLASVIESERTTVRCGRLALDLATLGYLTARIGLEVPDVTTALTLSDNQLRRMTNEAAREALQQRNFLGRTERYSNLPGHEEAVFVYALADGDAVSYPDLEVLRRLVGAQLVGNAETARGLRAECADLIERNLQKWIEAKRNDVWHCLIQNNPFPAFGGARAQIGLELAGDSGADGYKFSDGFAGRIVQQAWGKAVDHFNFLSRGEDYQQPLLPEPPAAPTDDAQIPFSLEIIKLFTEALIVQDKNQAERATGYTTAATALVQRNLVAVVDRARRIVAQAQLLTDKNSFGYVKGRLALELPNGLSMSDDKRGRLVNEAEELLADSGRWKFMEGQYILAVAPNGRVVVPADIENIIYAEVCGHPVELRDRKWFYTGIATRYGTGWEGWVFNSNVPLTYAGADECGNANYILGGGCYHQNPNLRPPLRALCRRKWLLKSDDAAPMLVQNYPALKHMVQSLLNKEGADWQGSAIQSNSALKALDNQLGVETEGQVAQVTVNFPGLPRGGMKGRRYGR